MPLESLISLSRRAVALALLSPLIALPAAAQIKEIRMLQAGGMQTKAIEEGYVKPYTARTGVKVVVESPSPLGKIEAMVQSKNVTSVLVELGSTTLALARAKGLLEPLDWTKINPDPMFPEARQPDAFGYQYYSTTMVWTKGSRPLTSWADFWNVKDYPGKRSLPDLPTYALPIALLADGVKPENLYPLDLDRAFRSLNKIKGNISVWWQSTAQIGQLVESGEIQYAAAWNSRYVNNPKADFTFAQGLLDMAFFAIPKGADPAQKEAAMKLLHEMSVLDNQVAAAKLLPYPGASPDMEKKVPAETLKWFPTSPDNKSQQVMPDAKWIAEHSDEVRKRWQEFKLSL